MFLRLTLPPTQSPGLRDRTLRSERFLGVTRFPLGDWPGRTALGSPVTVSLLRGQPVLKDQPVLKAAGREAQRPSCSLHATQGCASACTLGAEFAHRGPPDRSESTQGTPATGI